MAPQGRWRGLPPALRHCDLQPFSLRHSFCQPASRSLSWKASEGQPTCVKLVWLWARCVSRVMVCVRLLDSKQPKKIPDAFWGATRGSVACATTIDVPPFSSPCVLSGLALANVSHPHPSSMSYCSKLPSEVTGFAFSLLGFRLVSLMLGETLPWPADETRSCCI